MAGENNKNRQGIRILYGDAVTVLPMTAADAAERASGTDCKILMCLSADPAARTGDPEALQEFANRVGCGIDEVEQAIAYWRGAGVLEYIKAEQTEKKVGRPKKQTPDEIIAQERKKREISDVSKDNDSAERPETEREAEKEPASEEKKPRRNEELPNYTLDELTSLLESRKNLSLFIDECQRVYGKMFNPRDVSKILGLIDYYSLDEEYVLTLLRYYGEMPVTERKSIGYIAKVADSLLDAEITSAAALREHLNALRAMKENEGQIRAIFGMGARAFTAKEKNAVLRWLGEFGCSMDLIRFAYDRTVNATSKPSILYAAKILERWHGEGLKTPAEVEAAENGDPSSPGDNFNTNDFFHAALRRSYGDDFDGGASEASTTKKDSGDAP